MEFVEASFATRTFCCWLAFLVVSDFFPFSEAFDAAAVFIFCVFCPPKNHCKNNMDLLEPAEVYYPYKLHQNEQFALWKNGWFGKIRIFFLGFTLCFLCKLFFVSWGGYEWKKWTGENHEVLDSNCWIYQLELGCCVKESFNSNWQCFGILTHFTHGPGPVFSRMSRWPSPGDSSCDLFGAPVSVKMVTPKIPINQRRCQVVGDQPKHPGG